MVTTRSVNSIDTVSDLMMVTGSMDGDVIFVDEDAHEGMCIFRKLSSDYTSGVNGDTINRFYTKSSSFSTDGGTWVHWRSETNVNDWGAVGDGVTLVGAKINNAIAYLYSLGGGTLRFPDGIYIIEVSLNLEDGIALVGSVSHASAVLVHPDIRQITPTPNFMPYRVQLRAADNLETPVITTPAIPNVNAPDIERTSLNGGTVRGFLIYGNVFTKTGSTEKIGSMGVHIICGRKVVIDSCAFYNHAGPAILQDAPVSQNRNNDNGDPVTTTYPNGTLTVTNCFATNCMLKTVRADTEAIFDFSGTNNYMANCEISGSGTRDASTSRLVAIAIRNADWMINSVLAEFADINWYFGGLIKSPSGDSMVAAGARISAVNIKGDQSQHENVYLDNVSDCDIRGIVGRSSLAGAGMYDAVHLTSSSRSRIAITVINQTSIAARYAFYDDTNNTTDPSIRNDFTGCIAQTGSYQGTGGTDSRPFYNVHVGGGSPMPAQQAYVALGTYTGTGGTTPNVNGVGFLRHNGTGQPVTNFLNATPGQELVIIFTADTVVTHNTASIVLLGGRSRTIPANQILVLKNYENVWYEKGSTLTRELQATSSFSAASIALGSVVGPQTTTVTAPSWGPG